MKEPDAIGREFIDNAIYRLDESTRMIRKSTALLHEEDLWKKPNTASNSIGNLILHLCGNMHQYIVAGIGNTEDIRVRDKEFSDRPDYNIDQILEVLEQKLKQVKRIIRNCSSEELLLERAVQGFELSGIGIILHVVEHYSYHTGQIAFWIKLLKEQDLGFYDGIDLNTKNN